MQKEFEYSMRMTKFVLKGLSVSQETCFTWKYYLII